ncbi:MAG: N-acetylmuramic acid 6-phosphate etherase [Lentisphaeria bacterium]
MMITESVNPESLDIDQKNSLEIVQLMNQNDQQVAQAVQKVLPEIARAIDLIVEAFQKGGRLFYIGAGTSGRLGIVDAAECPPTFGVEPEQVQGIIAGGYDAIVRAKEFAEDDPIQGWLDLQTRGFCAKDVLVGLATSGRTPYTCGALKEARKIGATTIAVFNNPDGVIQEYADVAIVPVVGPEVVTGSTRLKAGTAQKMVINMLSTASMIRSGRVIGNLLVDMKISCEKLQQRAVALLMRLADVSAEEAQQALDASGGVIRGALHKLHKGK